METIDEWRKKRDMNIDLCKWFNGLSPEKKKGFWRYDSTAKSSHDKMNDRVLKNNENKNPSTEQANPILSSPKTMTRRQFESLEKSSPQEAMDFCLNGGEIKD